VFLQAAFVSAKQFQLQALKHNYDLQAKTAMMQCTELSTPVTNTHSPHYCAVTRWTVAMLLLIECLCAEKLKNYWLLLLLILYLSV
jgi:hypothetical protein